MSLLSCFSLTGIWTVVQCHRQVRYDFATWLQLSCETWTDVVVRTGTDAEKVY